MPRIFWNYAFTRQILRHDSFERAKLTESVKRRKQALRGTKKKKSRLPLVFLTLLIVTGLVASWLGYFRFIEPLLDARKFEDSLKEFGARELEIPRGAAVAAKEIPRRTGKVLVVIPEHTLIMLLGPETIPPKIHPAWYRIDRSIRASDPTQVDTLVRISSELRGARRFDKEKFLGSETKVVSAHKLHLDVYDWQNQTYMGRWTLDPGNFKPGPMSDEEIDKMIEATSNSTVLKFVNSMPE